MLSIAELQSRGVDVEPLEVRAWRIRQQGPTGRRLGLRELADLVGCSVATIGRVERGSRRASHTLRVRLWSLILGGALDWARPVKPIAKAGRARMSDVPAEQMLLPFAR